MPSLRSNRPSRTASPFVPTANGSPAPSVESQKEKGQTLLTSWMEPQPRAPVPSFEDHGFTRGGVLENMQALGSYPGTKLRIRLKNYAKHKSALSREEYLRVDDVASETPEGTPPVDSATPNPIASTEPSLTLTKNKNEDEDGDYGSNGVNGHASRSGKRRAHKFVPASPVSRRGTSSQGSPTSQKSSDFQSSFDDKTLNETIEDAVSRFEADDQSVLAQALERMYHESQTDHNIASLIDAILLQHASTEQFDLYAEHIKRIKKQIKRENKIARRAAKSDNSRLSTAGKLLSSYSATQTMGKQPISSRRRSRNLFISSNLNNPLTSRSSSPSNSANNSASPISPTPVSTVNGIMPRLPTYPSDYGTRSKRRAAEAAAAAAAATGDSSTAHAATDLSNTILPTTTPAVANASQPNTTTTSSSSSTAGQRKGKAPAKKTSDNDVNVQAESSKTAASRGKKNTTKNNSSNDSDVNAPISSSASANAIDLTTEDERAASRPKSRKGKGKATKPYTNPFVTDGHDTERSGKRTAEEANLIELDPEEIESRRKKQKLDYELWTKTQEMTQPDKTSSTRFQAASRRSKQLQQQNPAAASTQAASNGDANANTNTDKARGPVNDALSSGLSSPVGSSLLSSARTPTPDLSQLAPSQKRKASEIETEEESDVAEVATNFPNLNTSRNQRSTTQAAKRQKTSGAVVVNKINRFGDSSGVLAGISPRKKGTLRRNTPIPRPENATERDPSHDLCDACGGDGKLICCDNCANAFHFECADSPKRSDDEEDLAKPFECNTCRVDEHEEITTDEDNAIGITKRPTIRVRVAIPDAFGLETRIQKKFDAVSAGPNGEFRDDMASRQITSIPPYRKNDWKKRRPEDVDFWNTEGADLEKILKDTVYCSYCNRSNFEDDRALIACDFAGCKNKIHMDCVHPPRVVGIVYTTYNFNKRAPFYCQLHTSPYIGTTNPYSLTADSTGRVKRLHKIRRQKKPRIIYSDMTRGVRNNGNIEVELEDSDHEYEPNTQAGVYAISEKTIQLDWISKVKL